MSEYAPAGKSSDEIRGLWQWVGARLNAGTTATADEHVAEAPAEAPLGAVFGPAQADPVAFVF